MRQAHNSIRNYKSCICECEYLCKRHNLHYSDKIKQLPYFYKRKLEWKLFLEKTRFCSSIWRFWAPAKNGYVYLYAKYDSIPILAGVIISKFESPAAEKSVKIDLNTGSISLDSSQQKSISKPNPLQNISNDSKIIA